MREQVEKWLEYMRPAFVRHRGDIQLVDVDEATGIVRVKLEGACKDCAMSTITLKAGVEATLLEEVPGVTEVVAV
ncbi:MAG: NifU family protein [Patescibacteria group bacterium]